MTTKTVIIWGFFNI